MSGYEYALAASVLAAILVRFRQAGGSWGMRLAMLTSLAMVGAGAAQLLAEGVEWKWVPLYALVILLCLLSGIAVYRLRKGTYRPSNRWARSASGGLALVYAGGALVIGGYAFPDVQVEEPTGPYAVGTVLHHWVDEAREETYTASAGDRREVLVRLWYPAERVSGAKRANYGFGGEETDRSGAAPFLYKVIAASNRTAKANAYEAAPISQASATYPVLVFSPGFGGSSFMYASILEELASRGYIVAAIQHPYFSYFSTRFPDGRVARGMFDPGASDDWQRSEDLIDDILVPDVRFVLDKLEELAGGASGGALAGKLDVARLGMLGHSFGGAVTAQAMAADSRIKAGLGMDGFLYGRKLTDGLKQPYLYMITDDTAAFESGKLDRSVWGDKRTFAIPTLAEYERFAGEQAERHELAVRNGGYTVAMHGANHYDFSDGYLYSPLIGSVSGKAFYQKIDRIVLAFFDQHLLGRANGLLSPSAPKDLDYTIKAATPGEGAKSDE
ncbi:alpha/beta hydrolase family protein [Paenibacillus xanthanilyticus]|uniref:Alpha/beta hydrolase family protein n=1 Tax=Paenibacillus xanthanilyticus TaxID=1783531 RepID=A0ABV8K1F6_9BACL